MTCPVTIDLGAYMLGALGPADDERVRRHMRTCRECRSEHDELWGLPGWLSMLTRQDVESLEPSEPSPAMLERLLDRAAEDTRVRARRRVRIGIAAAAAVLAAAVAGGQAVTPDSPRTSTTTLTASNDRTHLRASVRLIPHGWGTQIALQLSGVAPGERCILVARARDGRHETAASWVATYDGTVDIRGTTAISHDDLRTLDVMAASGRRLLTVPVVAGSGRG